MSEHEIVDENPDQVAKEKFSKDIITEDFYIPEEDIVANEFEVDPERSFAEDLQKATETKETTEPVEESDDSPDNTKAEHFNQPESDFFDQPAPEDDEKKKVVEEIAGMAEVADDRVADDEESLKVSVQFKDVNPLEEETAEQAEVPLETANVQKSTASVSSKSFSTRDRLSVISRASSVGSRVSSRKSSAEDIRSGGRIKSISIRAPDDGKPVSGPSDADTGDLYLVGRPSIKMTYRESYVGGRRRDLSYGELGPRFRAEDYDEFMGFDISSDLPFQLDEIVEEEEETIAEEEEHGPVLYRKPYYERHDQASEQINEKKMKNFLLQKKLAIYFKRKKMDYVTKETDWSFDQQNKYNRKLEAYGELMEFEASERARVNDEINASKKLREEKYKELTTMFKKMQNREAEIGFGLIHAKTGKPIPDKHVERLIHRQLTQMHHLSSMRLTNIRLKQMVQEKLDGIANLDEIAPGFRLAEYEQLKIMNQSYADKIEEKDEMLTRLRAKCSNTIQILAHLREKTTALNSDLGDLQVDYEDNECEFLSVRSRLNKIKQKRDVYRHEIDRMRNESGLLTQPKLLKDMEQGLTDVKVLSTNLELLIQDYKKRSNQIKAIRKKIEGVKEQRRTLRKSITRLRCSFLRFGGVDTKQSAIYKGRPTLMIPDIDENVFDSLRAIKPKITYDRSRYHTGIKRSKRVEG